MAFRMRRTAAPSFSARRDCGTDFSLAPEANLDPVRDVERLNPAWRWNRAVLVGGSDRVSGIVFTRADDRLIAETLYPYVRFVNQTFHADPLVLDEAKKRWPGVVAAYTMYEASGLVRHYLEAMILTGAETGAIADSMCLAADAVWWYEKAFFDVRPYLDPRFDMRINLHAVWPSLALPGLHGRQAFEWKIVGRALGLETLRKMAGLRGEVDETVLSLMRGVTDRRIVSDALFAAHSRLVNQFNAEEVIGHYHRLREIESGVEEPRKVGDQYSVQLLNIVNGTSAAVGSLVEPPAEAIAADMAVFEGRGKTATDDLPERFRLAPPLDPAGGKAGED